MANSFWRGAFNWLWGKEREEEFNCESCGREISKKEYEEFNGLCRYCRGAPTQRGFPSPPGFPKV